MQNGESPSGDAVSPESKYVYSQVDVMPIATSTDFFHSIFLLIVLMLRCRNGWGECASRGRQYPVSFLIGLRFFYSLLYFLYIVSFTGITPQR